MTRATLAASALLLLASGCGGSSSGPPATSRAGSPPTSSCRKSPLAGVHSPDRLRLLAACGTITGTVREPRISGDDGDAVFNLAPDRRYALMLNRRNVAEGGIHVEIVPADQPGCRKGERVVRGTVQGLGSCTGAHVRLPAAGAHVRVVGAFVLDVPNGWHEIHPAWRVTPVGG